MGYKPQQKHYVLEFVDYPGLEIEAKGTSIGKLVELAKYQVPHIGGTGATKFEVFDFFADRIIRWNIEHPPLEGRAVICSVCALKEGEPMPSSSASLMCLELDFVMRIIYGWMETVGRVSAPKDLNSSNGENAVQEAAMKELGNLQSPLK